MPEPSYSSVILLYTDAETGQPAQIEVHREYGGNRRTLRKDVGKRRLTTMQARTLAIVSLGSRLFDDMIANS